MKPRLLYPLILISFLFEISAASKSSSQFLHRICTVCQHGGSSANTAPLSTKCRTPEPPTPGFISCTNDHTSVNCVGTCMAGYNFPDGNSKMILQCNADSGLWYPQPRFPNCVEEESVNERERYRESEQNQRRHEDPNEKLSRTLLRCQKPSTPANGYYKCQYDDTHMKCVGRCNAGYLFPGRRQEMELECKTENGNWFPYAKFPDCTREGGRYEQEPGNVPSGADLVLQRCQKPSAPSGGRYSCTYDVTQMTCIGRCQRGYAFPERQEEIQIQCRADTGYWHPHRNFPDCVRESDGHQVQDKETSGGEPLIIQRCQRPVAPSNGYYNCNYDETKMTCVAKCNRGHLFPGRLQEMQIQCYARNGYWYPSKFMDCVREEGTDSEPYAEELNKNPEERYRYTLQRCKTPPAPANGYYSCKYNDSQMACVGTCNTGYLFPGRTQEMHLQCQTESAYWYPYRTFPNCTREGDRYNEGGESDHQQRPESDDSVYIDTLTRCRKPKSPVPGRVSCTYDTEGMQCTGTCSKGYYFASGSTNMVLQCSTKEGVWHPVREFPQCQSSGIHTCYDCSENEGRGNADLIVTLRRCRRPGPPIPGNVECQYNTVGMNCTGTCKQGYHFPDYSTEKIVQCLTNSGTWYPAETYPECTRYGYDRRQEGDGSNNRGNSGIHTCQDCSEHEGRGVRDLTVTLRSCRRPGPPIPGNIQCQYDSVGMNCTGTCKQGYYFPDYSTEKIVRCLTNDGIWYPAETYPECTRYGYDRRQEGDGSNNRDNSGIRTCQDCSEHEGRGNTELTVTLTRCRRPGPPTPGNIQCQYDTVGMNCTGTCKQGYYFPDYSTEKIVRCLTNSGIWYPAETYPVCTRYGYDRRQEGDGSNNRDNSGIHTCQDCSEHEGRGNTDLTATLRRCRRPSPPIPGNIQCQYDSVGMNCTGTCKQGYYFPDYSTGKIARCLTNNGIWYPAETYPECSRFGDERYPDEDHSNNVDNSVTLAKCLRPPSPSPGRISCTYNGEGMSCYGTCSVGYYFPDGSAEMVLNCSTREGFWRPATKFPPCESRGGHTCQDCHQREDYGANDLSVTLSRCRRPSTPIPGRINCMYDYLGMNCTAICKDGYYFPDGTTQKVIQCLTNTGTWHPIQSYPNCIEYGRRDTYREGTDSHNQVGSLAATLARCKVPSAPVPGQISCNYNTSVMTCIGTCSRGHLFPGRSNRMTLECKTSHGIWFPVDTFPQCEAPGYRPHRPEDTDQQTTSSNPDLSSVTLSRCRSPSSPIPGEVSCQYDSLGMNCTGTCKEGHHFKDGESEIIVRCLTRTGFWHPFEKYPECVETTYYNEAELERMALERRREEELLRITLTKCRRPIPPALGYLSCSHDIVGMNCTGRCREGYSFPDGARTKYLGCITERGFWAPEQVFPECKEIGHQNRPDEGQQVVPSEEENQIAITLIKCKRPAAPSNGVVYCRHNAIGMNCTGRCDSGHYYLDGSREKVLHCLTADAIWRPRHIFPSCFEPRTTPEPVPELELPPAVRLEESPLQRTLRKCKRPEKPKNGYIICKPSPIEMNCTGWCNFRHHYPDGSNKKLLHCTGETGIWRPSHLFPDCIELESHSRVDMNKEEMDKAEEERLLEITLSNCRRPLSPTHGDVSCNYDRHRMNCTGTCASGYKFPDGRSEIMLTCNTDRANWYPLQTFPTCVAVVLTNRCRKPFSPLNGHVACFNDSRGMTCAGRCVTGYFYPNMRTIMERRCSFVDGKWHPAAEFPDCSKIDITPDTTEGDHQVLDKTEDLQRENNNREDACNDRPEPPHHGFLSCMEESHQVKCIGTCLPDYKFTRGESTMALICSLSTGRWTPRSRFPPCFMERTSRPNLPNRNEDITTKPPRYNRHEEGTDSEIIEELDRRCPRPTTPKGGYIDCTNSGSIRKCTGTCMSGYVFPNGRSYFILRCSLVGTWTPGRDFPDCVAKERYTHTEEGERGEETDMTSEKNRTNLHQDRHTGSESGHDQTRITGDRGTAEHIQGYCRRPATPKSGYIYCVYNANIMECTGKCGPGYRFPSGETSLIHSCDQRNNRWYPTEAFPDCRPVCDSPCNNGGLCVRPNQCFCPQEYRGDYCQHPLSNCDPRLLRFAGSIRCNHTMEETVCELGCPVGTKLDYPSYRVARCSLEGSWTPRYAPRCIEDPAASHSNIECGNSQCSSAITEGLCQKPATPRPGSIRCIYNKLIMECTGKCAEGYKFTDGRRENIRTCDKKTGVWSPVHSFPECKPICERGCQNGGECLAPNTCICPMRFRGDQCQFSFSNCDPHRLRFAGSIRCNHTTTETVCQLGCPSGTVLDRPAYEMIRCTLEGIWSPSVLPHCVEDITYERRLLESDKQSGMRYEHQYRQSEISRTEAERFEQQNREGRRENIQGGAQTHDRQVEGNGDHRYEQSQTDKEGYEERLSRLEQEDRELYKQPHRGDNRGTLSHERDEFNTNEGRFRHYDDFLQGKEGMESYGTHRSGEHRRSSSHQTEESQELRHQYYRQSVNKQKTETYREHSSQSQHQYSHYHKQHERSGKAVCPSC